MMHSSSEYDIREESTHPLSDEDLKVIFQVRLDLDKLNVELKAKLKKSAEDNITPDPTSEEQTEQIAEICVEANTTESNAVEVNTTESNAIAATNTPPSIRSVAKNKNGWNEPHYAPYYSKKNVDVEILSDKLSDKYKNGDLKDIINQKTKDGFTPLDYAYNSSFNSPIKNEIVSLLRKYGGKANEYDKNGNKVGEGKGDLND